MDAIILCGGLATRLQSVTLDKIPKCLVEIGDKPFIYYQFDQLRTWGVNGRVILALGKFSEQVIEYVQKIKHEFPFDIWYSIETEPLGTGGALAHAWRFVKDSEVVMMNGDVINIIDLDRLRKNVHVGAGKIIMASQKISNTDRYGVIKKDPTTDQLLGWTPKKMIEFGEINRGVYYCHHTNPFKDWWGPFSFENEYVPNTLKDPDAPKIYIEYCEGYFIDIGIPEDYDKFCQFVTKW